MSIIVVILLCLCLTAAGTVYYSIAANRLHSATWESLVAQIQPIDAKGLEIVAKNTLQPDEAHPLLPALEVWNLLGGIEGLEKMRDNALILIALAAYAQQWNYQEAVFTAEHMRRDAARLKKAVRHVRLGLLLHRHATGQPFHVLDAAAAYYLMTQRLLALYKVNHQSLLPQLAQAL